MNAKLVLLGVIFSSFVWHNIGAKGGNGASCNYDNDCELPGICKYAKCCQDDGTILDSDEEHFCCSKYRNSTTGKCACRPNNISAADYASRCCSGYKNSDNECACVPDGKDASQVYCCSGRASEGRCVCIPNGTASSSASLCCSGSLQNNVCQKCLDDSNCTDSAKPACINDKCVICPSDTHQMINLRNQSGSKIIVEFGFIAGQFGSKFLTIEIGQTGSVCAQKGRNPEDSVKVCKYDDRDTATNKCGTSSTSKYLTTEFPFEKLLSDKFLTIYENLQAIITNPNEDKTPFEVVIKNLKKTVVDYTIKVYGDASLYGDAALGFNYGFQCCNMLIGPSPIYYTIKNNIAVGESHTLKLRGNEYIDSSSSTTASTAMYSDYISKIVKDSTPHEKEIVIKPYMTDSIHLLCNRAWITQIKNESSSDVSVTVSFPEKEPYPYQSYDIINNIIKVTKENIIMCGSERLTNIKSSDKITYFAGNSAIAPIPPTGTVVNSYIDSVRSIVFRNSKYMCQGQNQASEWSFVVNAGSANANKNIKINVQALNPNLTFGTISPTDTQVYNSTGIQTYSWTKKSDSIGNVTFGLCGSEKVVDFTVDAGAAVTVNKGYADRDTTTNKVIYNVAQ